MSKASLALIIVFAFFLDFLKVNINVKAANGDPILNPSTTHTAQQQLQKKQRYQEHYSPSYDIDHKPKYATWLVHHRAFGFNNQRQIFTAAAIVAHLLNRTLLLMKYKPNHHHDNVKLRLGFADLFDMNALRKCISVETASVPMTDIQTVRAHNLDPISVDGFVKFYKSSNHSIFRFSVYVAETRHFFKFSSESQQKFYDEFQRDCFRFNSILYDRAMELVKLIGPRYHAIHYRLTDMNALPCVDCASVGGSDDDGKSKICWLPISAFLSRNYSTKSSIRRFDHQEYSMIDAVADSSKVVRNDTIYISTNQRNHPKILEFMDFAASRSLKVLFFADVCNLSFACRNDWGSKISLSLEVSIIEQIISTYSTVFFPSFPSTWSRFVLTGRRWLGLDPGQDDMYLQKFLRFFWERRLFEQKVAKVPKKRRINFLQADFPEYYGLTKKKKN